MRINSLDIHQYSLCPRRYLLEQPTERKTSVARDVMKRIVLSKALGRKNRWTLDGVACIWDNIFWKNRPISQEAVDSSVKGSVSLRKLFNRLPSVYEAYGSTSLRTVIRGHVHLDSSADFMIESERGIEIWIHHKSTPTEMRKSIVTSAELFILKNSIRASFLQYPREIFLVFYYAGPESMNPKWFRVKCKENDRAVLSLVEQMARKIDFPSSSEYCRTCKVDC